MPLHTGLACLNRFIMPHSKPGLSPDSLTRPSLASEAIRVLSDRIRSGDWTTWLPSERHLCEQLKISRGTLRVALAQLRREGLINTEMGRGTRISERSPHHPRPAQNASIGVLLPDRMEQLPHNNTLLINSLRTCLSQDGYRLDIHESRQCYQSGNDLVLEKLTANNHHACWLLLYATAPVQQWFLQAGHRCIVLGVNLANSLLPTISPDYFGVGRHAAGNLLGLGHRHIGYVLRNHRQNTAGGIQAERGIDEALAATSNSSVRKTVIEFDRDRSAFSRNLLKHLRQADPPTAFIISSADRAVTTLTILLAAGYQVPRDISLICLAESLTIQHFTTPLITHYALSFRRHHLKILRLIHQLLSEGSVRKRHTLILPEFQPGESTARYHRPQK